MLDKSQIEAASRTLHDHWRAGTKLAALETSHRPRDRGEAYAIQAALENHSAGNLFGWKIAATSEAGQKHINVDGPMAGRILSETVLPDGGTASMAGNAMRVAETEFAFRMARDLPPRSSPYSMQQTLDAVATLHPAIEIPDSRFADFVSAGTAQIIAAPDGTDIVAFGSTVTFSRADGREQTYRIVGEDEADPKAGSIAFVSPVARAVIGKAVGDVVTAGNQSLEIIAIA